MLSSLVFAVFVILQMRRVFLFRLGIRRPGTCRGDLIVGFVQPDAIHGRKTVSVSATIRSQVRLFYEQGAYEKITDERKIGALPCHAHDCTIMQLTEKFKHIKHFQYIITIKKNPKLLPHEKKNDNLHEITASYYVFFRHK